MDFLKEFFHLDFKKVELEYGVKKTFGEEALDWGFHIIEQEVRLKE